MCSKIISIQLLKTLKYMMNSFCFRLFLIGTLAFADISLSVAQEKWKLERDEAGIKVYSKSSEKVAFKSFKAQMVVKGSIHSFVAILEDIEHMNEWGYNIKTTQLLERKADTLQIYYAEVTAPFPFENRDGIYLNNFRWDTKSKQLYVEIELLPDYLKRKNKIVRVSGKGYWMVKVLPNEMLDITFSMLVDPGGNIPAWMVNIMVDTTPFSTLTEIRRILSEKRYQNKKFNFIK